MLSISSTTIIVKALGELGKTKERFCATHLRILIVEDILAIIMNRAALRDCCKRLASDHGGDYDDDPVAVFLVVVLVVGPAYGSAPAGVRREIQEQRDVTRDSLGVVLRRLTGWR